MRRIIENISIGSANDSRRHGEQFDRVVSLASPTQATTDEHLIQDGEHDYSEFVAAVQKIGEALEKNQSILVHCNAGLSRSVSATIAALVLYKDWEYEKAYQTCKSGFIHPAPELQDSIDNIIEDTLE